MPLNCRASAEIVFPWQFACPGVPASGTVSPASENVILNVGAVVAGGMMPMMSVPIRSQSGFRFALRIHACKSVTPAGNGVPGGTIGLGAERYRKSPPFTRTSGRKK